MKFTEPWGWSKLDTFRQCPRKFMYQYIEKLPTGPAGPALVRGSRIHDDLDAYIKGWDTKLPAEAVKWERYIDRVRDNPTTTGEQGLGFDKDWNLLPNWFHKDTWLRVKMDAVYALDSEVIIVDWKTGKYRQPSTDQLKLYAAVGPALYKQAPKFEVEMVYIDHFPDTYTQEYGLEDIPLIRRDFEKEAAKLYDNESWPTSPSRLCRWCPYSRHNGGKCEF